jgi:aconitate hydratase
MPAGAKILPLRSNVPAISEYAFSRIDPTFPQRAKDAGRSIVIGGSNYGQGSSREHAALAPMYLGLKAVIAKTIARIHWANLINFGIVPLTFVNEADYDGIDQGDELELPDIRAALERGDDPVTVRNLTKGTSFQAKHGLTERQRRIVLAGGLLNYVRQRAA